MIGLDPREGFVNPDGRALEPGVAIAKLGQGWDCACDQSYVLHHDA